MGTFQADFGQNVRRIRKEKGISQEALGASIGMSPAYISQLEAGKANLTFATIIRLFEGLQADLSEAFVFLYLDTTTQAQIRQRLKDAIDTLDENTLTALYDAIVRTSITKGSGR